MSFRKRLARRIEQARSDDAGIALMMSLFVMLVVSTLAVGLLAVVLNETKPTQGERKQVRTINSANAGLQVVLNQLRAANDGTFTSNGAPHGALAKLPCTSKAATFKSDVATTTNVDGAAFSGPVSNGTGSPAYTSYVAYYASDPTGWFGTAAQGNLASNAMACPLTKVPAYAFVYSNGSGSAIQGSAANVGNRSTYVTYQFQTTNANIVGGRMLVYNTNLCLDAGKVPQVGTTLTFKTCNAIGYSPQMWSYRPDLSVQYEGNSALNLCIKSAATVGTIPTLQTCTYTDQQIQNQLALNNAVTTYPYTSGQQQQEWGFNDSGQFSAALDDGTVTNGSGGACLMPSTGPSTTPVSGVQLAIVACDGSTSSYGAWTPDPQVGGGMAGTVITGVPGKPTFQFTNYAEFGRCLDITGQNVNATYLIDYPCKQAPDASRLTFNQVWTFPAGPGATGTMYVTLTNGTKYCLTAPTTGSFVVTKVCDGTTGQKWTATGKISSNYAGSYELVSSTGQCLTADNVNKQLPPWSTITVADCDGTAKQKWNAPANLLNQSLSNLNEGQGGQ